MAEINLTEGSGAVFLKNLSDGQSYSGYVKDAGSEMSPRGFVNYFLTMVDNNGEAHKVIVDGNAKYKTQSLLVAMGKGPSKNPEEEKKVAVMLNHFVTFVRAGQITLKKTQKVVNNYVIKVDTDKKLGDFVPTTAVETATENTVANIPF
jgi:hypothetical protein